MRKTLIHKRRLKSILNRRKPPKKKSRIPMVFFVDERRLEYNMHQAGLLIPGHILMDLTIKGDILAIKRG